MGYTHYFRINQVLPIDKFKDFVGDVRKLINASGVPIVGNLGEDNTEPELTDYRVAFNGLGEDSYETFHFPRYGNGLNFCKTQYRPYDIVVVATLVAAHHHFGDMVEISSDGTVFEWEDGVRLCQCVLGYGECPLWCMSV